MRLLRAPALVIAALAIAHLQTPAAADALTATPAPAATSFANFDNGGGQLTRFDTAGNAVDAHDGQIRLFDGVYHLYGTSYDCGFNWRLRRSPFCGFKVYSSTDLAHWTDRGYLFDPRTLTWQTRCNGTGIACFRPHVAFNAATAQYVLWVNAFDVPSGYHVFTSSRPTGPFVEQPAPWLAVGSDDGPGLNNGDEDIFVDDDGTAYLVHTRVANFDIVVEQLDRNYLTSTGRFARLGLNRTEAPAMFKRNGRYYITVSDPNCAYCNGTGTSYMTAATPLGPWSGMTALADSAWQLTQQQLRVQGGGVGLSMRSRAWRDYTMSFDTAPVSGGGYAQAGWSFRAADPADAYVWMLGNSPAPGAPSGGLTKAVLHGGSYRILGTVPIAVTAGRWYHVETQLLGDAITTSVNGTVVDVTHDLTFASGKVGLREDAGEQALFDNVNVTAPDGTALLSDSFAGDLSLWDRPAAWKAYNISRDSCGGQPSAVTPIPQVGGGTSYLYQSDLWNNYNNEGLANYYWGPLDFASDGSLQPLRCLATVDTSGNLVNVPGADDVIPWLDQTNGRAGFRTFCDLGRGVQRLQTFTAGQTGTLTTVSLTSFQDFQPDAGLTIDVVPLSGDVPLAPYASMLSPPNALGWSARKLTLRTSIPVVAGQRYGILARSSAGSGCYGIAYNDHNPYPAGHELYSSDGGTTWQVESGRSLKFETTVYPGAVLPAVEGSHRPLTPARVLDTRAESLQGSCDPGPCGRLTSGQTLNVRVAGQGGVPAAGVTAVVLNVTAVDAGASGYLTVYPAGVARPTASNLNFEPGQTVANLAEVAVGEGGEVSVYNLRGGTDVVFDVVGYVTPGAAVAGAYRPLTPARLLDTRAESRQGSCRPGCARLGPGGSLDLQVSGAGGVPASGVSAVVLNVTVTGPSAGGYLTLYPAGQGRPLASNLNFRPGQTVANRVMVGLGEQGRVSIFNSAGGSDVVVDVGGWYTDGSDAQARGALYGAQAPRRILDTRETGGTLGAGQSLSLGVGGAGGVPADASAAVLNVTATGTTAASYLTVYPSGQARPLASDLNWAAGERRPNLVLVKLGSGGRVEIYNLAGRADIVVDVMGWYR